MSIGTVASRRLALLPFIVLGAVFLVMLLGLSGAWRLGFRPFGINPRRMNAAQLGFHVSDPADVDRVNGICRAFAGGFNTMIARPSRTAWLDFADRQAVFFRPFVHEGAAVGYRLRALWRFSPRRFEQEIVGRNPGFGYLYYVGLGFWHAMRGAAPDRLERLVRELDPLHGMLCWDGYGFKHGFFDYRDDAKWAHRFDHLDDEARRVAFQGMGRSLWFRYLGNPEKLVETLHSFGPYSGDAASGVGLAAVFASFDRLERGLEFIGTLPDEWRADVLQGMCFAFKARSINDEAWFGSVINRLGEERQAAVGAAIAKCDEIEAQIRADRAKDGYRRWRESLRSWLVQYIEYPFAALKSVSATAREGVDVSV